MLFDLLNMGLFSKKEKTKDVAENPAIKSAPGTVAPNLSAEETLAQGMTNVQDIIAPSAIEVDFDFVKIGGMFYRTLFISGYPRFVGANWLSPVINYDRTLEISMFYYPVTARGVLDDLKRKIGEMEATVRSDSEHGKVIDPSVTAALEDAMSLQEQLVKGIEKFFQFSFYITIPAESLEELNSITKKVESTLGSLMLISKHTTLQMEQGFQSTIPLCIDKLMITRNMDTTSLATTFPFSSSELSANEGVLYGINEHNGSLIIFDRFSMENANMVIFAKSGSGKSYLVKLEALRSLMFGTQIMVIDPEAEYQKVAEALNGDYISFSPSSKAKINPFDLPQSDTSDDNELGLKILSLHALLKIMCGELSSSEEATLDKALIATYKLKGITLDPATQNNEPPVMSDLFNVLMESREPDAQNIAHKLERYVKGSLAGIFDQRSNLAINNQFTVFSTQNLEDILRPIAIFIILDFIWTRVKRELRKRILIVDEAWLLMQFPDSAAFMFSIAKRARKYYLGLTTISQDVSDFLSVDYGKAIVTNSSIQILLRQHPAAIDLVGETFYLSEGEKKMLLACAVGEGIFFAGNNHAAVRFVSSPEEHRLVSTKPSEVLDMRREEVEANKATTPTPVSKTPQEEVKVLEPEVKEVPAKEEVKMEENPLTKILEKTKNAEEISKPAEPPKPESVPPLPQKKPFFPQKPPFRPNQNKVKEKTIVEEITPIVTVEKTLEPDKNSEDSLV